MNVTLFKPQMILHEAYRTKVYLDSVGKATIGIGRNLVDRGVFADEIDLMFRNDAQWFETQCRSSFPWFGSLNDVRQRVLTDMCFNMGLGRLKMFKKFLDFVMVGNYAQAAKEMLDSDWARQVGPRAIRLSYMMDTGINPKELS